MKEYRTNIGDREYNIADLKWYVINVEAGDTSIKLKDMDMVKDKFIYGFVIMRQSAESGVTRWSRDGNAILSRNEMAKGHISFKKGRDIITNSPLDFFGFDPAVHRPGTFAQLILPEGFEPSSSVVTFPSGAVTTGGDIQIGFAFNEPNSCVKEPLCL